MSVDTIAVGTVVKVTKNGTRYKATTTGGVDVTDSLETYQMSKAFDAGEALKLTETKNGTQWRKVSMAEYDAMAKSAAESAVATADDEHGELVNLLKNAIALLPNNYKMPELKWRFAVRAVLRGKNLMVTGPQGCGKTVLAFTLSEVLKRPLFNIPLGSTQDPRSVIIGNTHFKEGHGTFVATSYFVNAIQTPNAIVLLDELTRAHPDAWNLLMPVLDYKQRFLRIDESPDTPTIKVADGVTFIATANIGHTFTATRTLDAALTDRFTVIEVSPIDKESETELLTDLCPTVPIEYIKAIVNTAHDVRKSAAATDPKVSNIVSTRMTMNWVELIYDGFTFEEGAETCVLPAFSDAGGKESERTYVRQIIQKYIPTKFDSKTSAYTLDTDTTLPWDQTA